MKYYKVGIISKMHGLKGEVKIQSATDFDRFNVGATLYVSDNDQMEKLIIKTSRFTNGTYFISFEGLNDINLVEKYHSKTLFISDLDRNDLEDDSFYYSELIGLKVYNEENKYKGIISEILEVPQGYIIVIVTDEQKRCLVPFRNEFIGEIDKEKLIVKEIEGLFWK